MRAKKARNAAIVQAYKESGSPTQIAEEFGITPGRVYQIVAEDGFDDEALAPHDLVSHGHKVVPHIAADTRNEVQAALPECLEQLLTDIAFVGVELAGQVPGDRIQHGAVCGVAGGDLHGHDLALVVDDEVQLEAEKPPHAGLAARGQALEDLVTVDTAIVTDGKLG